MDSGVVPIIFTPARSNSPAMYERRLSAELNDDALGLLLLVDGKHVLNRERLEVELVGRVVVGGDGLGLQLTMMDS
jgi:hypothetical protein